MHAARAVIPEYAEVTFYLSPEAFYLQDGVGFPIFVFWAVVPLVADYSRFDVADVH